MRGLIFLLVLLLAPPPLTVTWTAPGTVRIEAHPGDVYRISEGLETWLGPAPIVLGPGPETDHRRRAAPGDLYELRGPGGAVWARETLGPEPAWGRQLLPIVVGP